MAIVSQPANKNYRNNYDEVFGKKKKLQPASALSDEEIAAELDELGKKWDASFADDEGHSGSPGEWMVERMDELETEQRRRAR